MGELPCTSDTQDNQLQECPSNHAGVGSLGLVSKFSFTLLNFSSVKHILKAHFTLSALANPLEYLLPFNIMQFGIQIPDFLHNIRNLSLIRTLNGARLTRCQIQSYLDPPNWHAPSQPTHGAHVRGREADAMVPRIRGTEGKAAFGGASGIDNPVVVVEDFVHSYGHAKGRGRLKGGKIGVELFGFVFSWKRVSIGV